MLEWRNKVGDLFLPLHLLHRLLYCLSHFFSSGSTLATLKVAIHAHISKILHTLKNYIPVRRELFFFLHLSGSMMFFNISIMLFIWNTISLHCWFFAFNMCFQCVPEIPWFFFPCFKKEKSENNKLNTHWSYKLPTWERYFGSIMDTWQL